MINKNLSPILSIVTVSSVPFIVSCNVIAENKPNIIVILVDDMGYGELSCYNENTLSETPNVDKLAQSGIKLTYAYASPVSSPTRACLLTGSFPQKSGVYGNFDGVNPGAGLYRETFPHVMQENGYTTAWFGKWHQGWDVSNHPANNGFDVSYGFLGGMHDYYDPEEGDHYVGGPFAKNAFVFDRFKPVREMSYFTEEITNRAVSFIKENSKTPFFIYLAYNAPHTPMQAPDDVVLKYLKKGIEPVRATRCAMLEVMDTQVGRITEVLKNNQLDKNTLIIFMSDNGGVQESLNGGLRGTKMTAWEGGVRVPMIASFPGVIPAGSVSESICSITDIAATSIGLATGDENYTYGDGVNLIPYYTGKKTGNVHELLVFSIHLKGGPNTAPAVDNMELLGIRLDGWKLVKDVKRNVDALYNLINDPAEQNDISLIHPEKKQELIDAGNRFFADCIPSCGTIRSQDTRKNGDSLKIAALKERCKQLLKDNP
jgi:arylsulfatase A-like enzyme